MKQFDPLFIFFSIYFHVCHHSYDSFCLVYLASISVQHFIHVNIPPLILVHSFFCSFIDVISSPVNFCILGSYWVLKATSLPVNSSRISYSINKFLSSLTLEVTVICIYPLTYRREIYLSFNILQGDYTEIPLRYYILKHKIPNWSIFLQFVGCLTLHLLLNLHLPLRQCLHVSAFHTRFPIFHPFCLLPPLPSRKYHI